MYFVHTRFGLFGHIFYCKTIQKLHSHWEFFENAHTHAHTHASRSLRTPTKRNETKHIRRLFSWVVNVFSSGGLFHNRLVCLFVAVYVWISILECYWRTALTYNSPIHSTPNTNDVWISDRQSEYQTDRDSQINDEKTVH